MKPHKHAELIKAWADGAEIEIFRKQWGDWATCNPSWHEFDKYRIKPELKSETEHEWMYIYGNTEEGKTWITPIAPSYYQNINYLTCIGKIKVYK